MSVKLKQCKHVFESRIGDEVVMLDVDSGFYFGLNEVASEIWTMLQHPITEQEIVDALMDNYEVDPQICAAETKAVLEQMLEHKIISVVT